MPCKHYLKPARPLKISGVSLPAVYDEDFSSFTLLSRAELSLGPAATEDSRPHRSNRSHVRGFSYSRAAALFCSSLYLLHPIMAAWQFASGTSQSFFRRSDHKININKKKRDMYSCKKSQEVQSYRWQSGFNSDWSGKQNKSRVVTWMKDEVSGCKALGFYQSKSSPYND